MYTNIKGDLKTIIEKQNIIYSFVVHYIIEKFSCFPIVGTCRA